MKTITFVVLLGALTVAPARAQFFNNSSCRGFSACAHSNSKECRDARNAFAEHHNGMYPEQFCNEWYQGQQGRWMRRGNQWQWAGAEGDQWYDGRQGHWFQEPDGWRFHGDKGEEYRKGPNGWQWGGGRKQSKEAPRVHEKRK
ncbi:MAG TPA: hypothetical protein VKV03_13435 [Candidatus Binataceae bacterium]|nr:hypothetical protein [Candidatus Binataceae bacterium]